MCWRVSVDDGLLQYNSVIDTGSQHSDIDSRPPSTGRDVGPPAVLLTSPTLLLSTATRNSRTSNKHIKGSPYSITDRRVPELIPVLGSQPAGDVSHKPGDRLPLLSARPAVTPATLKRAATNFAAW